MFVSLFEKNNFVDICRPRGGLEGEGFAIIERSLLGCR